jgi:hypothetical protein
MRVTLLVSSSIPTNTVGCKIRNSMGAIAGPNAQDDTSAVRPAKCIFTQ